MDKAHELAAHLSRAVQAKRLARIGETVPEHSVRFERLPPDDQRTWLDVADALLEWIGQPPDTERIRKLCDDYDRYGIISEPGWRNEMRFAVLVELRHEIDRLTEAIAEAQT